MQTVLSRLVLLVLVMVLLSAAPLANADDEPIPSIREIMQTAHRCSTAYIRTVSEQLRRDEPDWPVVTQKSKDLMRMGAYLGKNTPPRGDKEAWERITNIYVAHATIMADAAAKKDKETAVYHQKKLSGMCVTCHRAHK